ncbi:MAG: hypothetical protein ACI9MR_003499, partial [Myxococcota bacterium]
MLRGLSSTLAIIGACVATLAMSAPTLAQPVGGGGATPIVTTAAEAKTRLTPKFVSIETVEAPFGIEQTIDEERIVVELPGQGSA